MKLEDMILVSVDDHIVEPEDMFEKHIPARYKDKAPRVAKGSNGAHHWQIEDARAPGLGLNAVAGRPREEFGMEPVAYDQVRAGCFDVDARIEDMNVNGVLASVNFGSFPGFAGARFVSMKDKKLALAVVKAYNDWHYYDWCNRYPGRFIPCGYLPLWDVDESIKELKRLADIGFKTVSLPDNPAKIGLPSLHHEQWLPLYKALNDHKIVMSVHIGSAGNAPHASDLSPIDAWITTMPITIAHAAADWLFAGFWKEFPDLRLSLSEGGIGWVPYLLERADFTVQQHGAWIRSNVKDEKPSDVFKRHFITCFISDKFGLQNRYDIGVNRIAWECDYPHSDAVWPESPEYLWNEVKDLTDEEINLMTHENVLREFNFDPFSILGRENCTVGALRAQATHVDTTPKSRGGLAPMGDGKGAVTSADIQKILSHV